VLEHAGTGSLTRRIPTLHRAVPGAYVELNARDAEDLGIRNGTRVRLISRRGAIVLPARVNVRSQPAPGQVFVPSFDEHILVNMLTLDACCPLSGQPDYQKCAVRVERVT
jgi:nitrate reductase NapA